MLHMIRTGEDLHYELAISPFQMRIPDVVFIGSLVT